MKIFRRAAPILGLLSFGVFAAPLAAAPRTINDCEKIQGADAYNQCLASFGPVAHLHGMSPGAGGDAGGDEGGDAPAPVSRHRHWASGHRNNGRVYMELDAGAEATPVHTHTRTRAHAHRHWTYRHGTQHGHHRHH
jgi:hypothetical protein